MVVSQTLLQKMVAEQEAEMDERAKKDVESGAVAQMMVNQVNKYHVENIQYGTCLEIMQA